jgi:hypothetical protein
MTTPELPCVTPGRMRMLSRKLRPTIGRSSRVFVLMTVSIRVLAFSTSGATAVTITVSDTLVMCCRSKSTRAAAPT